MILHPIYKQRNCTLISLLRYVKGMTNLDAHATTRCMGAAIIYKSHERTLILGSGWEHQSNFPEYAQNPAITPETVQRLLKLPIFFFYIHGV